MSIKKEPQNLFSSTHVLSIMGFCYFTVISPAIDKFAEGRLNREDTIKTLNGLVYAILASSLKLFDKEVYTPNLMPGRNKEKALNNINDELIDPIQQVVKDAVQDAVTTTVDKTINNLTTDTINSIIPNNTVQNTIAKAVMPTIVHSFTDSTMSNVENTINNTVDDIANLFKTNQALKKNTEVDEQTVEVDYEYGNKQHPNLLINKQLTNIILTSNEKTYYKFEPINSSDLSEDKIIEIKGNTTIYIDSYDINSIVDNHIPFIINNTQLFAYIPHISIFDNAINLDKEVDLLPIKSVNNTNYLRPTIDQCEKVFDCIMKYSLYADFINCLNTFGINTPLDVCHFMAQCSHESGGLRYNKEIASGEDYEYRKDLGNIYEGDGLKYKGSGFIQLTGRFWYQKLSDFLKDPRVMEGVDYVAANLPFTSAGFWWSTNKMSDYINNETPTIEQVSTAVNGANPANGLQDRQFYFSRCKKIFNIA